MAFFENDLPEGSAAKVFFISSVFWFAVTVSLGLITATLLAFPDAISGISWLTFGRVRPVHVNGVIFAWIAMAFGGAMCYIVPALAKTKLWSEKLGVFNAWAWNIGIVVAVVTLLMGWTSGREYQELIAPVDAYVILFMLVPLAVNVFMTMLTRKVKTLYVTQWFFGAGLLNLAVLYITASDLWGWQGMAEAIISWWHAHNVLGLFISPVTAGIAYYIVPKVTGNALYSHKIGHLHFWTITIFYGYPGAHHLLAAPIPEYLKSVASITSGLIMIPAFAFTANILLTCRGKWHLFAESIPLRFTIVGILFNSLVFVEGAFNGSRAINWYIHGTHFIIGHAHMALLGFSSFVEIGAIYYAIPMLFKRELFSLKLAGYHFWMTLIGFTGFWVALMFAGVIQGAAKLYQWDFIQSVDATHPYMVMRLLAGIIIIAAQWIFLYNIVMTATRGKAMAVAQPGKVGA